jgi:hypothetical protein
VYTLNAKAAPHLEALLREHVPQQISCKCLEVKTDAEQVPQEPDGKRDVLGGKAEQPSPRFERVYRDAGKDGELAGRTRKDAGKK